MKTLLAMLLCATAASAGTRLPLQMDFDRCTLAAENVGQSAIQGRVRLELLVRKTGEVYGAFVHSVEGVESARLQRCLTNTAVLWKLPEVAIDYRRPYVVSFVSASATVDFNDDNYFHGDGFSVAGRTSAFLPDMNDPAPAAPVNAKLAQATLDVSETASEAEHGIAELAVQRPEEAVRSFRHALEKNASDAVALRGLVQALVQSHGDLAEARKLAERLVALDSQSVGGHEAMLRACLAGGDDECAFAQWRAARGAPDVGPRSRELAELQESAKAAAARLASATGGKAAAQDPCAAELGIEAQALCVVKQCLDAGTIEYAQELSQQNHLQLAAGEWKATKVAEGKLVVRRPIEGNGEHHDALWLVKVSDQLTMQPASAEARQIMLRHSRCAARTLGSR